MPRQPGDILLDVGRRATKFESVGLLPKEKQRRVLENRAWGIASGIAGGIVATRNDSMSPAH